MNAGYVVRRLLQVVPTSAAILAVGFLLIHLAPGEPLLTLAGEHGDAAYYEFMREKFGLDRPLHEQFLTYAGRVARGDLGLSYIHGRPAVQVIAERVPATLLLTVTALVLSSCAGIVLGLYTAARARRLDAATIDALVLTLFAVPVFWLGQMAILSLAFRLGWFPVEGITRAGTDHAGLSLILDVGHHLALPALVLASQQLAATTRLTSSSVSEELRSDHVRTARAKGLSEWVVLTKHALRRALLPVVTVIGARVGHLLAGAIVVEVVFSWPGLGRLLLSAAQTRDGPILLGIFLFVSIAVILANLVTDLLYGVLDPRVRYS